MIPDGKGAGALSPPPPREGGGGPPGGGKVVDAGPALELSPGAERDGCGGACQFKYYHSVCSLEMINSINNC